MFIPGDAKLGKGQQKQKEQNTNLENITWWSCFLQLEDTIYFYFVCKVKIATFIVSRNNWKNIS